MWFEALTGFREQSAEQVRHHLSVDGHHLCSDINGKHYNCGVLETPSLAELRERVNSTIRPAGTLSVREVVADVQQLHIDPANAGSLFQVASQFNLLEMISPNITPEQGVERYAYDSTQGPACAIAAGAGTIYRNYFVEVDGCPGQTASRQIDCLTDLGAALGNANNRLWTMQNGYALASEQGLATINQQLHSADESRLDELRSLLRIGIQWDTEVTLNQAGHLVSQAYCSALPVSYSAHSPQLWTAFARLVLEASYEACLCAAILNASKTGHKTVYLTLIGGGVFGNDSDWIIHAIERAIDKYKHFDLDVAIVSYARLCKHVNELVLRCR